MKKTIFVAGIHGVGKTYLCESIECLGLKFASASEIIKKELIEANWSKDKIINDAEKNQLALIAGVEKIRKHQDFNGLLLDGHFVLRTSNGFLSLDHAIFNALNIDAIILVEDEAEKIASRLESRDSVSAPKDLVEFLKIEREQAEKFSAVKSLPLFLIRSGDVDKFSEVVKKIIN